jgi:hypothetical protein
VEVLLKSKEVTITVNSIGILTQRDDVDAHETTTVSCVLNVADVPDNTELRTELGGTGFPDTGAIFHVKVNMKYLSSSKSNF